MIVRWETLTDSGISDKCHSLPFMAIEDIPEPPTTAFPSGSTGNANPR
jgi:hypothetical protein